MSRVLAVLVALCALLAPSWAQAQMRLNARVPARALLGIESSGGSCVGSAEFLQRDPEGFVDSVNVYAAMANDPINNRDPTGRAVGRIGWIYLIEGVLNGQRVFYVGSALDVQSRFDGHHWKELIADPRTKISVRPVFGDIAAGMGSGVSPKAAVNHALRSQEQLDIEEQFVRGEKTGRRMLNDIPAAGSPQDAEWRARYRTSVGDWRTIKRPGETLTSGAFNTLGLAFTALDAALFYRNSKVAQYSMAACLLSDDYGLFYVEYEEDPGFILALRSRRYFKVYVGGALGGVREILSKPEAERLKAEVRATCGYVDWMGDIVPGERQQPIPIFQPTDDRGT